MKDQLINKWMPFSQALERLADGRLIVMGDVVRDEARLRMVYTKNGWGHETEHGGETVASPPADTPLRVVQALALNVSDATLDEVKGWADNIGADYDEDADKEAVLAAIEKRMNEPKSRMPADLVFDRDPTKIGERKAPELRVWGTELGLTFPPVGMKNADMAAAIKAKLEENS